MRRYFFSAPIFEVNHPNKITKRHLAFVLFIVLLSCHETTAPDENDLKILDQVELDFYMIINEEKVRDIGLFIGMILEIDGKSYESVSYSGARFILEDIEFGLYDYRAITEEIIHAGSVFIDTTFQQVQFGTEYYIYTVHVNINEISNKDTVKFENGSVLVNERESGYIHEGRVSIPFIEKGELVEVTISSDKFETTSLEFRVDTMEDVNIYFEPNEYMNINGRLFYKYKSTSYPVKNKSVLINGVLYNTDNNGEFMIDRIDPGIQTIEAHIDGFYNPRKEILISSSANPQIELKGPKADFLPLNIGNYWKYSVSGVFTDAGQPDNVLNYDSEWMVESLETSGSDTIYTIKEIRNGYEVFNWASDTTLYNDYESHFFITIKEDGSINIDDRKNNFVRVSPYGQLGSLFRYNLNFFENVTVRNGYNYDLELDPTYSSHSILEKEIGLVSYRYTNVPNISTTSPWSVRFKLLEYNVDN
tara:strand:+ start:17560 stop:18987 length:1428 start_codon:yes stop_codon:yes gene_type:complete